MNKEKSQEVLTAFGNPIVRTPNANLVFARQNQDDINQIEKATDEQIIQDWKSLIWMNYIYGQVSLNDLQRISLLELEIDARPSINSKELDEWCKKAEEEFEANPEY